jgi:DNA invertase Pin-like site-specific DNA recombinase
VLLSFVQFEREVTGERIRDKFAASKRKGMWMGGVPPLGYDVSERRLIVNETEAVRSERSSTGIWFWARYVCCATISNAEVSYRRFASHAQASKRADEAFAWRALRTPFESDLHR